MSVRETGSTDDNILLAVWSCYYYCSSYYTIPAVNDDRLVSVPPSSSVTVTVNNNQNDYDDDELFEHEQEQEREEMPVNNSDNRSHSHDAAENIDYSGAINC